ncbi:AEC family transporter [Agilicoccus flavus]|uniref:AEC family transporter n=1 Tax=Agilicoccus flavus TaxID=2775968 RepID=UPI001CF711DE|nr:AEC family transporter [Agilicoccus flavus]
MLSALVDVILPVVLVAGVGVALAKSFTLDVDTVNKVSMYGFTPALAFQSVTTTTVTAASGVRLVGAYLAAMLVAAVIAWLAATRLAGESRRVVVGCTIIGNNGNFGLPIALLALGRPGLDQALVIFITALFVMFTIGPALLGASGGLGAGLRRVALLPVTWALALGLLLRGLGWPTPGPLASAVDLLAAAAVPLVLLSLGLQLGRSERLHLTRPVLLAVGLRTVVVPVVAYGVGLAAGLSGVPLASLVLACAMPTAVNAFMLAREFGADPQTAASAVALSTFVSIPLIAVVVAVLPALP